MTDALKLADEIEMQIEEAAAFGEPPSFALPKHQADALVSILRQAGSSEAEQSHPAVKAIAEHNRGCHEACGKTTNYEHTRKLRNCDLRRDCPDCPLDWLIAYTGCHT